MDRRGERWSGTERVEVRGIEREREDERATTGVEN